MLIFAQPNAAVQSGHTTSHAPDLRAALHAHPVRGRIEAGLLAIRVAIEHQIATTLGVDDVDQRSVWNPFADRVLGWDGGDPRRLDIYNCRKGGDV